MFLIKKSSRFVRELVRPLNFTDKLLRLLETAQNNCRTHRRYMREKDSKEGRERGAKNREQRCEEEAEGKTSLTIYYVGCQHGTRCPRNEFIKYFIRVGRRESRNDTGDAEGWSGSRYQSERERSYTKGHPFYNSPLRNNPLCDATENARVTSTWLRAQALSRTPCTIFPSSRGSHDNYTASLINATYNYDISADIESIDNPIIEGCKVGRDFKVEVTETIFPVVNGK